jgi:glycosyltransferase involved in cell wall biosynthesis
MVSPSKYLLMTNVYNGRDRIEHLFEQVNNQVVKPELWIIIDDGSCDGTWEVIEYCVAKYWDVLNTKVFVLPPKQHGDLSRIGQAYNYAFSQGDLHNMEFDFMSILDVDCDISPYYYQAAMAIFDHDVMHKIGILTGVVPNTGQIKQPEGNGKCIRWEIIQKIDKFWDPAPDTFLNIISKALGYRWDVIGPGNVGDLIGPKAKRNTTENGAIHAGWMASYVGRSKSSVYARVLYRMLKGRYGSAFLRGYHSNSGSDRRVCDDPDILKYYHGRMRR